MVGNIALLILMMVTVGCAPVEYTVRNADASYLVTKVNQERLACIGSIPIRFGDKVPYGPQQSVNYKTKDLLPSVWIDVRSVISNFLKEMTVNRVCVYKGQNVESLLIKEIKHENNFDNDTGASIISTKLRARVVIDCKGHGNKSETILVGDGPPVSGGFFGSNANDEAALARSTTYAVYDLLSKVQEVCRGSERKYQ